MGEPQYEVGADMPVVMEEKPAVRQEIRDINLKSDNYHVYYVGRSYHTDNIVKENLVYKVCDAGQLGEESKFDIFTPNISLFKRN